MPDRTLPISWRRRRLALGMLGRGICLQGGSLNRIYRVHGYLYMKIRQFMLVVQAPSYTVVFVELSNSVQHSNMIHTYVYKKYNHFQLFV